MTLLTGFVLMCLCVPSILTRQPSLCPDIHNSIKIFVQQHLVDSAWTHSSSWTGDNASRLMINYISTLGQNLSQHETDEIFGKIVSRSLSRRTILQYLTQGYDDFGWTAFSLLEMMRYSYQYEDMYPDAVVIYRLPILRERLAFRAGFLHDVMEDSWTSDVCGGGAEWKVRSQRLSLWPSVDLGGLYKNTITNHLYNSNNAQIYSSFSGQAYPHDITEKSLYHLRSFWKLIRIIFGWPRSRLHPFDFNDIGLLDRTRKGIKWMQEAQLLTNESLYIDGQRPRFAQVKPTQEPEVYCDASVDTLYTYNQLAGTRALRYLSRAMDDPTPVEQGHQAIRNLISSTYNTRLGLNGIIKEACDEFGTCTQDMQIFKGLLFLDIQNFCAPISWATPEIRSWHGKNCSTYQSWIRANAAAACATVDQSENFGSYWHKNSSVVNDQVQIRSFETQVAGLAVLLVSSWFGENFNEEHT